MTALWLIVAWFSLLILFLLWQFWRVDYWPFGSDPRDEIRDTIIYPTERKNAA